MNSWQYAENVCVDNTSNWALPWTACLYVRSYARVNWQHALRWVSTHLIMHCSLNYFFRLLSGHYLQYEVTAIMDCHLWGLIWCSSMMLVMSPLHSEVHYLSPYEWQSSIKVGLLCTLRLRPYCITANHDCPFQT